jgi:hypothetical protein
METKIIALYCLCDDFTKHKGLKDWHNVKFTSSEVMFVAMTAMRFFYGNLSRTLSFLVSHKYISNPITFSALNKRIHKLGFECWHEILEFIQIWNQKYNMSLEFIVDSFPVSVCRNIRIQRCQIYQGEEFRGYNKSKREYFYGLKATVVTTRCGCPYRVILCPGREHDIVPFRVMDLDLPEGSEIYGDSAYTDYEFEDRLLEEKGIKLIVDRKLNSKRPLTFPECTSLRMIRGQIETSFGKLSEMLPRKIQAVTQAGFELKVLGFIAAFAATFVC